MIRLLKKMRFSFIEKENAGKYFKYAIGEIILVVLGILIALQVNEWNSERNRKKTEIAILIRLQTDLKQSQKELEDIKVFYLENARASTKVIRAFWKTEIPNDSIEQFMLRPRGNRIYSPILGTAKSLINSGNIDLLSSAELKNVIISYVETVDYTLKDISRYEETYYRKGIEQIDEAMPNTYRSLEDFRKNEQNAKSDLVNGFIALDLYYIPDQIDKVPFQGDLRALFQDKNLFQGYRNLHISHRNIYYKYNDILIITNELLERLEKLNLEKK